ncbi:MvdC/MvdD family ATP grasp protein [Delftia sp. WSY_7]|uniref:MvdC/MvdD family ATP grasp protein n=1 Tax=Delftia sp. WSY_7 TaxID=3367202 RepID=UPI00370A630E
MTTDYHVLILSTIADVATDYVVQGLLRRGVPHHRVNTEDLPFSRSLTLELGTEALSSLELDGRKQPNPSSIWYRRIRSPARPPEMQEGVYEFCLQENRAALLGSISAYQTRWMSHPADVWRAELKPYQLQLARRMGLRVPKTLVTNDPNAIRKAFHAFGPMIVKPSRSGYAVVDGQERSIYTSRLLAEHLEHVDEARLSPAIYQELIPKRYDIRATVVGTEVFAAAIHSQTDPAAAVDWRHTDNPDLPHTPIQLPANVRDGVLALMSKLGLTFGAVDLVETPDGEFVFLEVNPNGQWLWIDDQLQLGITDAIVDWLARA